MKKLITCVLLFFYALNAVGQGKKIDTLRLALIKATRDTTRMNALKDIATFYLNSKPDSDLIFSQQGYELALKTNRLKDQAYFLNGMGNAYLILGDYVRSLNMFYLAKNIDIELNDLEEEAIVYNNIGWGYYRKKEYNKARAFLLYGLKIYDSYKSKHPIKSDHEKRTGFLLNLNIEEAYRNLNKLDSANFYLQTYYSTWKKEPFGGDEVKESFLSDFAELEKKKGNKDAALAYFRKAMPACISSGNIQDASIDCLSMADLFHHCKQQDSAEFYAQKALHFATDSKSLQDVLNALQALYAYYEEDNNLPLSHKYLKLATATNDSLFSQDKMRQILSIDFDERQKAREIEVATEKERTNVRIYFLIFGMISFSAVAFLFWRENKQRKKTNKQLQKQQTELDQINQNLELMVYERTKDLEDKNDKLFKYSYYLSHQIRGPISTIKGLVNIEKEGLCEPADFIKMVGVCVDDIDSKIVEINDILHDQAK